MNPAVSKAIRSILIMSWTLFILSYLQTELIYELIILIIGLVGIWYGSKYLLKIDS